MPDSGDITICGSPVNENPSVKEKIAFIPDELFFYGTYNLNDMASLYRGFYPSWNQERFEKLVLAFGLDVKRKIIRFSKGMQKQAAFALAVSSMPELLILDEPVDGLDPIVRKIVWNFIVDDVAEREMTVLISSHNLKEIEGICDTVAIMWEGNVVLQKELDDLKSNVHKVQVAFSEIPQGAYDNLNILKKSRIGSVDMLIIRNTAEEIEKTLSPHNPLILDRLPLTLEEIFIYELGGDEDDEYSQIFA